jgi:putative ABC transport system permease protein
MDIIETIAIAFQTLAANKVRSALTMLGVIIGVLSVVLLVALGEGARQYVTDEFAGLGTNILIVTPGKTETTGHMPPMAESVHKLTFGDSEAIKKRARGVKDIAPIVFGASYVKYEQRRRSTTVIGTTSAFPDIRNIHVDIGSFITDEDVQSNRRVVAIGRTVKQELFGSANPLGKLMSIGGAKFRVVGIMEEKGMSLGFDIDDLVFIPVKSAQELFNTDALLEILVAVESKDSIELAEQAVKKVLMIRHNNTEDFTIVSQAAMLSSFETIMKALTFMLTGIASISLLVGGIGIMNIMLVSVSERIREVGIRKAVGAKDRHILIQFMVESTVLSSSGGTIGILIGWLGAFIARKAYPALPTHVSMWSASLAFGFSCLVGVFFGVYPARKAAQADPVEALRYE